MAATQRVAPMWVCGECGTEAFTAAKPTGWAWFNITNHWACQPCSDTRRDT